MRAVLIFVVVVVIFYAIIRGASDDPRGVIASEAALNWTLRAIGALLAASAAFALLLRGMASESLERQFGLVLPLLGGVLLVSANWSIALAFGGVGVALIAKEFFGRPRPPSREDAGTA